MLTTTYYLNLQKQHKACAIFQAALESLGVEKFSLEWPCQMWLAKEKRLIPVEEGPEYVNQLMDAFAEIGEQDELQTDMVSGSIVKIATLWRHNRISGSQGHLQ